MVVQKGTIAGSRGNGNRKLWVVLVALGLGEVGIMDAIKAAAEDRLEIERRLIRLEFRVWELGRGFVDETPGGGLGPSVGRESPSGGLRERP